jgi:hypothetical protein
MTTIGIDLSLRSTGLAVSTDNELHFKLIETSSKELNDERLVKYNTIEILKYIFKFSNISRINLEGLSFGSISNSKDIIAGNFWYLRCALHERFPNTEINIVPVLTWRSPLFSKEDRALKKIKDDELKNIKEYFKDKSSKEKRQMSIGNKDLIQATDIKHLTFLKLPIHIQDQIKSITETGIYDLSDAFFLSQFIPSTIIPKIKKKKKKLTK